MAFCGNCGEEIKEGAKFCANCGASTVPPNGHSAQQSNNGAKVLILNNTADTTAEFDAKDIQNNKGMAILAYLSWLVLIPLLAAKDSKFARYHTNQGLVLAIAEIVYGIAYMILSSLVFAISWRLYFIINLIGLVGLVFLVLTVIGIINAANGQAKELPVIGKFKILK